MEGLNNVEISADEYRWICSQIESNLTEEEFIKIHNSLIGKSCKSDYFEVKDCGESFICKLLTVDHGRSIVYKYKEGALEFIQSKYLSDYFKASIKKLLSNEALTNDVLNALNNDKALNDMSEEEILSIFLALKEFMAEAQDKEKIIFADSFMSLLYKLNGPGVVSFIKNNINSKDIAKQILSTSGLNSRSSFYSGRGVNRGDLNERNLFAIFKKLYNLDESYATNFIEMVRRMKTLGATEFINSFMNFAASGFKFNSSSIEGSNVSFNGVYGAERDLLAYTAVKTTFSSGRDKEHDIMVSEQMKDTFTLLVNKFHESPDFDFDERGYCYIRRI